MVITAADVEGVLSQLIAREPIFHRPEWGITRADFCEVEPPGRILCGAGAHACRVETHLDACFRNH